MLINFKYYGLLAGWVLLLCATIGCQNAGTNDQVHQNDADEVPREAVRVISLSGFLTELLYALDAGDQVVGVDVTSTYPESVNALPKLGHISQLNAEGILSLKPDIIFVQEDQMRQSEALEQLSNAAIEIVPVPVSHTLHNSVEAAKVIARYVNIEPGSIEKLENQINTDSAALQEFLSGKSGKPSVLFIYARGGGNLMVAGKNTSAEAIITQAGGKNAVTAFDQFRALTPEALVQASPDVILMFDSGLASLNGKEGLAEIPGISQTTAYKENRIIAMDGHYLTSFGPRTGQAALELARQLYQEKPES